MTPADIDCCQFYDAFTGSVVLTMEALGFCAKGEGGPFVADGKLRLGGALPTNTDGGGLSACHPGMRGMFLWSRRSASSGARPRAVRSPTPSSAPSTGPAAGSPPPAPSSSGAADASGPGPASFPT